MSSYEGVTRLRVQAERLVKHGWTKEPFILSGPYPQWIDPDTGTRVPIAWAYLRLSARMGGDKIKLDQASPFLNW